MVALAGNDVALQVSEAILSRVLAFTIAQQRDLELFSGKFTMRVADAGVRVIDGDGAAVRVALTLRAAAAGSPVLAAGSSAVVTLRTPVDFVPAASGLTVTLRLAASTVTDQRVEQGADPALAAELANLATTLAALGPLADQAVDLPVGAGLGQFIRPGLVTRAIAKDGALVLVLRDPDVGTDAVDLGVDANGGFAAGVSAGAITHHLGSGALGPGNSGAFTFDGTAGTMTLFGGVVFQHVPADVIIVLAPFRETQWLGLHITDFAFGPGVTVAASILLGAVEVALNMFIPMILTPAVAIGAGVGANEVKKFVVKTLEPALRFAVVTEQKVSHRWRRVSFESIEVVAEGLVMRGDLTYGPSPYIWIAAPSSVAATAVGTPIDGEVFFEDWSSAERDECGRIKVRITKRATQQVVSETDDPLRRRVAFSFVHNDPAAGGYDISVVCSRLRWNTLDPVCMNGEAHIELTDRLDLSHPFVQWEHVVERPAFLERGAGKGRYRIRTGIMSERRISRIHRTDVAGRCRFVTEYSRDCDDPFFLTQVKTAKLSYFDVLPFPTTTLVQNRAAVCDYCFFGGPDKSVPQP